MKILHTADWHIGSFKGPEKEGANLRSEDTMKCLRSLVETAEKENPDLVLVSGDIFHQAEIWQGRSHKEVLQAREIILALSRAAGQVIVMRGTPNHDSEEAFLELKAHFEFIDNIKIVITPELVRTSYADIVAVPGFDKGTFRAQHPGISKEDENIVFSEELGKIVVGMRAMCSGDVPAILMSHYTVPGCNTESGQTQFLTQFEPVITQDMLLAADYDLVALGHIHRPQMINGLRNVYYSGAVNAMNFNDEGQDRGFWLYEMKRFSNEKWDISDAWFRKTPYREFITFHFTDTDITAINLGHIEEVAFNYWTYNGAVADKIVRVLYTCSAEQKKIFNTALLEKALYEAGAFWVAGIEAEKIESANRTELSKQEDPETNLIQYLQEKLIEPKKIDSIVEKARPIIAKAKANSAVSEFFGTFVPKEIEVKNYRNYVEQYFSFEDISFCTINGSNGSGKSSLFMDAIVDCLYEEPREGTNTGWIRNDEKARSGSISFTFGLGDKTFRVVRTRTKSGKPTLNLSELLENEWVDRSKEKIADTQKEIIRLLGMDSLTFKACVLIMQDQYGLFLEAGKEERVGVLSNLLGLGIYGIMEDLVKDELGNLKRDIAKKRQTINIHSATIESYGKPEDEKTEIELKLNTVSEDRNNLAKQKEDKSLLLRMQREAQERHDKVQASVNTLMQKNEQEGQNIAALERNIESCNAFLADEEETILKVERYDLLLEKDREYAKAAVAYMGKHEELVRIHDQEMSEEQNISRLKTELTEKQNEKNEMILDSANDGEVRQKAGEYEQAKKALDEAFDADRTYKARGVLIGKMHPNEAYEIIHNNDIRDEQIVEDVKNCVSAGRTPVVLSRYKDHSEKLYERLKDYADHVFLMTGNNSKKEHKKILEQMHQVYKAESLILIATGSLVGEGFDFPRLDTLFMATPVSFRGVVEQYAGRLNRDYAGKENVIIYDYVDNHITMFNNMYMKRLKAYKQIGYEIAGGLHNDKQTANAIYDGDNYAENYHKDLLDANKNIIISSPAISGTKVYELINLLKEKQLSGVQITIVTWAPDSYGFGDASYWMQLHEEMRKAGFYIKTVEESCERFAVIDQEVVWYGNINLLAKDKVDDSIMRVLSKEIASELMEITFGDNG